MVNYQGRQYRECQITEDLEIILYLILLKLQRLIFRIQSILDHFIRGKSGILAMVATVLLEMEAIRDLPLERLDVFLHIMSYAKVVLWKMILGDNALMVLYMTLISLCQELVLSLLSSRLILYQPQVSGQHL